MKFYYVSLLSLIFLGTIYVVGTVLLLWLGARLRKRMQKPWTVIVPLLALLYIGPVAEELWIAWNFGQLCRKDAGIFVYKTVEVDGFYDDTRSTHDGPRTLQAVEEYEEMGYRFYEKKFRDTGKVVHIERTGGVWVATVLDQPTARYHYTSNIYGELVKHKITRQESLVTDTQADEVIGRYVSYGRSAPWFFVALDRPPYSCDGPDGGPNGKHNRLIYRQVLTAAR